LGDVIDRRVWGVPRSGWSIVDRSKQGNVFEAKRAPCFLSDPRAFDRAGDVHAGVGTPA
jgi:hypothetical protein